MVAPSATEARAARERLLLNLNLAAYYRRLAAAEERGGVVRDALVQDAINKLTCARAIRRVYGV